MQLTGRLLFPALVNGVPADSPMQQRPIPPPLPGVLREIGRRPHALCADGVLSAQPQIVDDGPISLDVVIFYIVEQPTPASDQHQQPATRMVVLGVNLQMLGEILDAVREQSDLNFRASRVAVVQFVLFDQSFFVLRRQSHCLLSSFYSTNLGTGYATNQLKTQQ
jgi:hypothetical protein